MTGEEDMREEKGEGMRGKGSGREVRRGEKRDVLCKKIIDRIIEE